MWREYEPRTLPVMIINFVLPPDYYDINLSTDKKQVLFVRVGVEERVDGKEDVLITAFQEIFRSAVDVGNTNLKVESVPKPPKTDKKMIAKLEEKSSGAVKKANVSEIANVDTLSQTNISVLSPEEKVVGNQIQHSTPKEKILSIRESSRDALKQIMNNVSSTPQKVGNISDSMDADSNLFSNSSLDLIPTIVDRCKKSKKRRDRPSEKQLTLPFTSSNPKKEDSKLLNLDNKHCAPKEKESTRDTLFEESILQHSTIQSSFESQNTGINITSQTTQRSSSSLPSSITSEQSILLLPSLPSNSLNEFDQSSNISQRETLKQFDEVASSALNSYPTFSTFLQSEFAGEENNSVEAEQELTRVLQKVSVFERIQYRRVSIRWKSLASLTIALLCAD